MSENTGEPEDLEDPEGLEEFERFDRSDRPIVRRKKSVTAQRWARWLHVYSSMICLLVVLFFSVTGLTLNHPSWTFGSDGSQDHYTGTLPAGFDQNGQVDFLAVTEFIRGTYDVKGRVSDYSADPTTGTVSFKAAGYSADLFFDLTTGDYDLTVDQQGFVAVMNDLHKGRDTGSSWGWVIDASAVFLVFVSLTGICIQIFYRKRRRRALITVGVATVVTIVLIVIGMG